MTRKNNIKIISVVHPICCGLDVHKDMVSACIIISEADGEESFFVKEFSTFTDDLYRLKAWLLRHACKIIAMESTIVAVAHRITKAIYYIIKHNRSYIDLGEAYLISKSKEKRIKKLKMNARRLGFSLVPADIN